MKRGRKIGVLIIMIIVVMQFVQPNRNVSDTQIGDADISKVYSIPHELHQTLISKCYDCHSNNTNYPWYSHIQPFGWWLAAHVHDGKEELNFSDFKNYPTDRAKHKLEELKEVVEERSMPLKAYTMFHKDAEVTDRDEQAILNWLKTISIKPSN